jgi:hypothetical protein
VCLDKRKQAAGISLEVERNKIEGRKKERKKHVEKIIK